MLDGVSEELRMRLTVIARAGSSPDECLEAALGCIIPDDDATARRAIAHAFRTNDHLADQWHQAWHQLRTDSH